MSIYLPRTVIADSAGRRAEALMKQTMSDLDASISETKANIEQATAPKPIEQPELPSVASLMEENGFGAPGALSPGADEPSGRSAQSAMGAAYDQTGAEPGASYASASPETSDGGVGLAGFTLPTVEELTPNDLRPKPVQQSEYSGALTTLGGTPEAESVTRPGGSGYVAPQGAGGQLPDFRVFLRQEAAKRGIDPDVAERVMGKEGPSGWDAHGVFDTGESFGPLQLHYAGGSNPKAGMGDRFTSLYGVHAKDAPLAAVEYALDEAAKKGNWSEWYGADPALGSRFSNAGLQGAKPVGVQSLQSSAPVTGEGPRALREGEPLTPDQFNSGLSTADAYAACGVVAAVAFARKFGRNPTVQEATNLARQFGWSPEVGMGRGTAGTVDTANALGAAVKAGPVDNQRMATDVQRGNPVGINLGGGPGNNGHFLVAERYDPESGKFDFGNSAKALKASGGNTWFTLAELPRLGFGSPRDAIYADAPDSPSPSVVAGKSQPIKGVNPDRALAEYAPMAQLDLSGMPAAGGDSAPDGGVTASPTSPPARDDWRSGGQVIPSGSGADSQSIGNNPEGDRFGGTGDPRVNAGRSTDPGLARDIRSDYAPRATVDAGDFELPRGSGAPVGYNEGSQQPLDRASPPPPGGAVEPASPALSGQSLPEAPASSGNPIVDLFTDFGRKLSGVLTPQKPDYSQPAQDIQQRQATLTGEGPSIADVVSEAVNPSDPSLSRSIANTVAGGLGTGINETRIGFQNAASDATGGMIPEGSSERIEVNGRSIRPTRQAATEFAGDWMVPTSALPEVRGIAATSQEALDRLGRASQGARGVPAPAPAPGMLPEEGQMLSNTIQAGGRAAGAGVGAGYEESQQEGPPGETPEERIARIARSTVGGAATSIANSGTGAFLRPGRRPPMGAVARAVPERAPRGSEEQAEQNIPRGARPITLDRDAEIKRLRLDKTVSDLPPDVRDDVSDILIQAAEDENWYRTQRRGVIPDEVAAQMADDLGRSDESWIRGGRAGRAYNEEEILALKNASKGAGVRLHELNLEIEAARAAGSTPDLLIAQRAAQSNLVHGLQKVKEGSRAEAGRSLRAWREADRLIRDDPQKAIARIYEKVGGREEAQKIAEEYSKAIADGANPYQLADLWAKVERGEIKTGERFALYRRFNMLSGPRTVEVNATGGALQTAYELASALGESAAHADPRGMVTELAGPLLAMKRASRGFMQTLAHGITEEQALRGDIPFNLSSRATNKLDRAQLTVQEIPDRINAAVDTFYRTTAEGLGLAIEATQRTRHLKGRERAEKMADIIAEPDKVKGVVDNAQRLADRITLQGEMGATGRALQKFQQLPYIGNILLPFLRTVYHGTARSIDLSPLGLATTAQEVARSHGPLKFLKGAYEPGKDLPAGVPELNKRIRDNIIGTMMFTYAYDQARQGNITGQGPDDVEKRNELRETGWRPYSIKIGGEYHSYANFMPFALALSMGAAAHEVEKYKKPNAEVSDVMANGIKRTVGLIQDMSVVAGMGAVFKSIEDPDRYGGQWLTQLLQTLVPAGSALNTVGQAQDSTERRSLPGSDLGTRVREGIQSRLPDVPGVDVPFFEGRTGVPSAFDPRGKPIENPNTGIRALIPTRPSPETPDPLMQAFLDTGVDIGRPPSKITFQNREIELTPQEQRRYREIMGETLDQRALPVITGDGWAGRSAASRKSYLQSQYETARERAQTRLEIEFRDVFIQRRRQAA